MKQELLTQIAHSATLLTVTTSGANKLGWFDYISANAGGLSVLLGCASFLAGIIFYIASYVKQKKYETNKIEVELMKENQKENSERIAHLDEHIIEVKELIINQGKSNERETKV